MPGRQARQPAALRWRTASNRQMPAGTETTTKALAGMLAGTAPFHVAKEDTPWALQFNNRYAMGSRTLASQRSASSGATPTSSAPSTSTLGPVKRACHSGASAASLVAVRTKP